MTVLTYISAQSIFVASTAINGRGTPAGAPTLSAKRGQARAQTKHGCKQPWHPVFTCSGPSSLIPVRRAHRKPVPAFGWRISRRDRHRRHHVHSGWRVSRPATFVEEHSRGGSGDPPRDLHRRRKPPCPPKEKAPADLAGALCIIVLAVAYSAGAWVRSLSGGTIHTSTRRFFELPFLPSVFGSIG